MPALRTKMTTVIALFAVTGTAHADLKVVQSTTMKNPQLTAMMQSLSPQQRANMGKMGGGALLAGGALISTLYSHGSKTRVDVGPQSTIVDVASHKIISINRMAHTYSTTTDSPKAIGGQVQANIRDTGQTRVILGHPARHYIMVMTSAQMQGGRITGDIWSAQDLPQPPGAALAAGGPTAALQSQFRKIKGMPLLVDMNITGSPIGATTVHSVTTSVSRAPVSASLFTVPAGYKLTAPRRTPGMMPMGR